jgi:hypothetical protein
LFSIIKVSQSRAEGRPRDRLENLLVVKRWGEVHQVQVYDIDTECFFLAGVSIYKQVHYNVLSF